MVYNANGEPTFATSVRRRIVVCYNGYKERKNKCQQKHIIYARRGLPSGTTQHCLRHRRLPRRSIQERHTQFLRKDKTNTQSQTHAHASRGALLLEHEPERGWSYRRKSTSHSSYTSLPTASHTCHSWVHSLLSLPALQCGLNPKTRTAYRHLSDA